MYKRLDFKHSVSSEDDGISLSQFGIAFKGFRTPRPLSYLS